MVQHENISTAERSWTHPLNSLQEAIHYSFIKSAFTDFSLGTDSLCTASWDSKKLSTWSWCEIFQFHFLQPRGCLINPFRTVSLCFGVTGRTPGIIFRNNFVITIFLCIGHHYHAWQELTRCSFCSVVKGCGIKCAHKLLFPKSTFRNRITKVLGMFKDSVVILDVIRRSFLTKSATKALFMSVRFDFEGHNHHHFLPAPFRLEIKNTV